MSDRSSDTQDTPPEATQNGEVNTSRRKLTGAALGVSAVFTLASRPVWANQCTISGMASGNLSAPKVTCEGCTPGFWKQPQHLDTWNATGFRTSDKFNTVFGVTQYNKNDGTPYTLLEVMQVLNGDGNGTPDPISPNLGFHAVAALLNAGHASVNYGYTSGEIIALFKNTPANKAAALKDALAGLNERDCPLN